MTLVARKIRTDVLGRPVYAFVHPCDHVGCRRPGVLGFGVKRGAMQQDVRTWFEPGSRWFCWEHRAEGERAD